MTIDALADLLKSRGCEAVCYFHTDHFEPWSTSIDDTSARAVERMAEMARASPYARKLSLFYSVFVPYRLQVDGPAESGDVRVSNDGVVFGARSARQEELARDVIRRLVATDGHEMHLHVHHEFWTRNGSHFDHPVSRWVNDSSTPEADRDRLDLHFRLCKEAIAREIGAPLERWAFIHGNWALNASDPLICQVSNEMATIMRHGGFGDFSFPAGRGYCDPKLETPFTCLPLDAPRAYDDPQADPRPIGTGTRVLRPGRFLIWNSPIKSSHSSLDYYSASNRALFKSPERVVATWLTKSVCLGQKLFIKTHAHSMKWEYQLSEPDTVIPHCYPDVSAIFECLARVCDRAGIELRLHTVNEIVGILGDIDGVPKTSTQAGSPTRSPATLLAASINLTAQSPETNIAPPLASDSTEVSLPPITPYAMTIELATMHRAWMEGEGAQFPVDELYQAKLASRAPLEAHEIAIASDIASRYPAGATRIVEIGCGWGGLAMLLARLGFEVFGFEGNLRRHTACRWHFDEQIRKFPILSGRLHLAPVGLFPEFCPDDALAKDKINLCVVTNITSSYSADNQHAIAAAAAECDELILDLARFGKPRDSQSERDALFQTLTGTYFRPIERLYFQEPYEYWRFRSRAIQGAARIPPSATIEAVACVEVPAAPGLATSPRIPPNRFTQNSRHTALYSVFGDQQLTECPVCHSADITPLWRMPATTLAEPIQVFGGYFNQIPTLQIPGILFCFDFCHACESIFLNPVPSQQKHGYRTTDHYIRKMQTTAEWRDYEQMYDSIARWIPAKATVMIDAACGIGQYLHIARRHEKHRWKRMIGLELAEKYVEHMRSEGLEAYVFDIDNDDLLAVVPLNSVDFIFFCEAFEHVERPLDALRKLLAVLRPGGRLYFTAQRYGHDVQAAVRPGEPIYIGEKFVDELPQRLGCRIVRKTTSTMRYYIVLEK